MSATGDYTKQIHISATPEKVFDSLTTAAEFASWWAPATGSAAEAGELCITFDGIEDPLVLQVKQATRLLRTGAAWLPAGLVPPAMPS